jgi:hypothetical protein
VERIGTWVFLVVVVAVGLAVALSFAMNAAADDLRAQVSIASGAAPALPRTAWGTWLSASMAGDLPPGDSKAQFARADDLDHRADRIRELAAAGALAGLLLMLVTARVETRESQPRSATSAVASTRSNGTV